MENGDPFVELIPQDVTIISAPNSIEKDALTSHYNKFSSQNDFVTPCKFSQSSSKQETFTLKNAANGATSINGVNSNLSDENYYASPHKRTFGQDLYGFKNQSIPWNVGVPSTKHLSTSSSVSSSYQDSSKINQCQELFAAKNSIIEQKDIIMQKQKTIISQLRQTNLELEELLVQKQEEIQASGIDSLIMQVREYKYENAQLKQKLTQMNVSKSSDVEKLQQKLGEYEYEHGKLKIALKEVEISKVTEVSKLQQQLEMKEHILSMEQRKTETFLKELKEAKQENLKLQLYLEELPTSEEYKSAKNEVKALKKDKESLIEEKDFFKKKNTEFREEMAKKDLQFQDILKTNSKMKEEIIRVSNSLEKYKLQDEKGQFTLKEYQDALSKIKSLESENMLLKKSLEKRHKKLNRLHYDLLEKEKASEDQKISYENTIRLLTQDLNNKELSITKINARNQEIMSCSLDYQQELKKYKECYTQEYMDHLNTLFKEICKCAGEVKSFVKLCNSRMKGNEPDLNALLGLNDSPDKSLNTMFQNVSSPTLESLQLKIKEIVDVRKEVDNLRHTISEQYAQEIGNSMCISQ